MYILSSRVKPKNTYFNLIRIFVLVIVVFGLFYYLTWLIQKNQKLESKPIIEEIQYEEILGGETFRMLAPHYYVLFFEQKDPEGLVYDYWGRTYLNKGGEIPLYMVDLSRGFNEGLMHEESNKEAQTGASLKISGPTLIEIRNGKNVTYKEGLEEIRAVLKGE